MRLIVKVIISFVLLSLLSETHALPQPQDIQSTLQTLQRRFQNLHAGRNASYISYLAQINPNYFSIVIATVDGKIYAVGDANIKFPLESLSKAFAYALALNDNGPEKVTAQVGLNATGRPFNSITALKSMPHHLQNPFVNAGAIQITDLIKGKNSQEKWQREFNFFQKFTVGKISLGETVYHSESETNKTNRMLVNLLYSYHKLKDPQDSLSRYTKACSVLVTTRQLAVMAASLANGGKNPITHQQVIPADYARDVLSEMVVNGLYDNSGAWWWQVGLPAKSGVGGGLIAVVPNIMGIAVYSPPLDEYGNSVRAQAVIGELSRRWKLHLLRLQ